MTRNMCGHVKTTVFLSGAVGCLGMVAMLFTGVACQPSSVPHARGDLSNGLAEGSGESSKSPVPASSTKSLFADRVVPEFSKCDFDNGRSANMNTILEIVGGGVGCWDFNGDGNNDLFFACGGQIDAARRQVIGREDRLLRGDGEWGFHDCTRLAHLDTTGMYCHGMSSADWNQDGFVDLLVYGYQGAALWKNLGDGTFEEIPPPAFLHTDWTTAAAWIDVNGDHALDCYLSSYVNWNFDTHQVCPTAQGEPDVCSPNVFAGMTSAVFVNNLDGTFSYAADLLSPPQPTKTLSVMAAEFSPGSGVGIYVANDLIANFMFLPRSSHFEEIGSLSGVAVDDRGVANGSMGLALLDFDRDQQLDIFVTNFSNEQMALYENLGNDSYEHASRRVGLNRIDSSCVGFGTVAGDFDGDADEDLVFTCGQVYYHPDRANMEQPAVYLQNIEGKSLLRENDLSDFFSAAMVGRGLAAADIDNDGDLDLLATQLLGAPRAAESGDTDRNWIELTLVGTIASRTPVGATVYLSMGEVTQTRQLYSGGSYLSQSQQRLHFAWPKNKMQSSLVTIDIHWPDGSRSQAVLESDRHHVVVQPLTAN